MKKNISTRPEDKRYPPIPAPRVQPTKKMKQAKDRKGWKKEWD